MLDHRVTIKKNYEFKRLYNKGKTAVTPYFVVYTLHRRQNGNRVGFTVSAKLGKAVVRNRIRRRLREVYRLQADRLTPGHDLIIVARSRALTADFGVLCHAFVRACSELGMVKEAEK